MVRKLSALRSASGQVAESRLGEMAVRTGVRPSLFRYYERIGTQLPGARG